MIPLISQWELLIEEFLKKIKEYPKLWKDSLSKDQAEEYLAFYGLNGGLFVESDENGLCGLMTVHPGSGDFNWTWNDAAKECTVHVCWAKHKKALNRLMLKGLMKFKPETIFYIKNDCRFSLTPKKVERLTKYGR